jgi:hypothetical protein
MISVLKLLALYTLVGLMDCNQMTSVQDKLVLSSSYYSGGVVMESLKALVQEKLRLSTCVART